MTYIRTIWEEGASRYGIVKIVPPAGWSGSNRSTVADHLKFTTRLQDVHKLRHRHRGVNDRFLSYVEQWYRKSADRSSDMASMPFPPRVEYAMNVDDRGRPDTFHRHVDLYQLYMSVARRGGYGPVNASRSWGAVAADLSLPPETAGDLPLQLEDIYVHYLCHLPSRKRVLQDFPPPPNTLGGGGGADGAPSVGSTSSSTALSSPSDSRPRAKGPAFKSVRNDACVVSCYVCSEEFESAEGVASTDASDAVLTCASCGHSCHERCFSGTRDGSKGLFVCDQYSDGCSYGFAQGGQFTLAQYKAEADEMKRRWFKDCPPGAPVPWRDIEQAYWEVVEDPTRAVYVKYGNDLDTKRIGSGFPSTSNSWRQDGQGRSGGGADGPDPWNLNILPSVAGSLLKYSSDSIKGINVPWLYCGSMFSTFCYHAEDLNMMSINYMHESDDGGGKVWYGAPSGPGALAFEAAMQTAVPELYRLQPNLQYELVTMVSPVELQARGATVFRAVQRPGEYILTFPQAFHGGFSLGYNVAEAVNFFTPECFPWMRVAVRRSRKRGVDPVFNMASFLLDLGARLGVHGDLSANDVAIIAEELEYVTKLETGRRLALRTRLFGRCEENCADVCEAGTLCAACGQACHMSILKSAFDSKFYCLACVLDDVQEFVRPPPGSPPRKRHRTQYFVEHTYYADLAARARIEAAKLLSRDALRTEPPSPSNV
jgi:hypothetical protein